MTFCGGARVKRQKAPAQVFKMAAGGGTTIPAVMSLRPLFPPPAKSECQSSHVKPVSSSGKAGGKAMTNKPE